MISICAYSLQCNASCREMDTIPMEQKELELRRIKDVKNKRERKRKDKKQDVQLLAAAELWTAEAGDEHEDVSAVPEQGPFFMCFLFLQNI